MAVNDWLNANVVGNLSLGDIGSSALDFYNTWQNREGANKAYDEIVGGYDQGIDYLKETGDESKDTLRSIYGSNMRSIDPYQKAGTTALGDYMNLMENPERITSDPGYQFRYDVGSEAQRRDLESAGYADPMGSGARPLGMETWAQGFATQELDSALDRRIPPMNLGSTANQQGIDAGAYYGRGLTDINKYMGLGVADMYGGKADALATKEMIDTMAVSNYIKGAQGLLSAAGNPSYMALIGRALSGETDSDGNSLWGMLADAFGFDPEDEGIMGRVYEGILGGDDNRPAGWGDNLDDIFDVIQGGTPGINPNADTPVPDSGANSGSGGLSGVPAGMVLKGGKWVYDAATVGAAGEAGAGTTAGATGAGLAAASPLLIFGAIVALDQFLGRGDKPAIQKQLKDMAKSANPLQNIMEMSNMGGLLRQDHSYQGDDDDDPSNYNTTDYTRQDVQRGALLSGVFDNMSPDQAADFGNYGTHEDRNAILHNMIAFVQADNVAYDTKRSGFKNDGNKWDGLAKLFPSVSQDDWQYFSLYDKDASPERLNKGAGDYTTVKKFFGLTHKSHGSIQEAYDRVRGTIIGKLNEWTTTSLVNNALNYNAGGAPSSRIFPT